MAVPVLLNRHGGALATDPRLADRAREALSKAGLDIEVELLSGGDCSVRCQAIAEQGDPLVIVGGGDGTISAAASALAGTNTKLGILPLGTLNHFARDLDIPTDLDEAARLIARGGDRRVDIGEMNERVFINNSAIGLYPLMVIDRDLQRKRLGRSKRLAMIVASLRTLGRFNHHRLTLTLNDERTGRVDTPLLFVGNNDYRIDIGAPGHRERMDGGELCVLVMRKKTRRGLLAASLRALFGRSRGDDMVRVDGVERLGVSSPHPHLAVSLDGEVVSARTPLDYRIRKGALRVIAPSARG
ncbi:MAG TPA: diacylglycerol kinase family protein [Sphingomicrobium sp.]|jgi:diacylglycerol kinase family enzyme|nr:diacylglycerol kinase family protein [Sphingomicrobium sp.]